MAKSKITHIADTKFGIYFWCKADGLPLTDENANVYAIKSTFGDIRRIKKLKDGATAMGYGDGTPVWQPDVRPITDEEYQEQIQRMLLGLTPDPWDLGAMRDDLDASNARR